MWRYKLFLFWLKFNNFLQHFSPHSFDFFFFNFYYLGESNHIYSNTAHPKSQDRQTEMFKERHTQITRERNRQRERERERETEIEIDRTRDSEVGERQRQGATERDK